VLLLVHTGIDPYRDEAAKVLKGFGDAGVLEVIEDDVGGRTDKGATQ
jgi:hypothetical protein